MKVCSFNHQLCDNSAKRTDMLVCPDICGQETANGLAVNCAAAGGMATSIKAMYDFIT